MAQHNPIETRKNRLTRKEEIALRLMLGIPAIAALGACQQADNQRQLGPNEIAITITPSPTLTPTMTPDFTVTPDVRMLPTQAQGSSPTPELPSIPAFPQSEGAQNAQEVPSLDLENNVFTLPEIIARYNQATKDYNTDKDALLAAFPGYHQYLPFEQGQTVRLGLDRAEHDSTLRGIMSLNFWTLYSDPAKHAELIAAQDQFANSITTIGEGRESDVVFTLNPGSNEARFEDLWIDPSEAAAEHPFGDEYIRTDIVTPSFNGNQAARLAQFAGLVRLYAAEHGKDWSPDQVVQIAGELNTLYEASNLKLNENRGLDPIFQQNEDGTLTALDAQTMEDPYVRQGYMTADPDGQERDDQYFDWQCVVVQYVDENVSTVFGREMDSSKSTTWRSSMVVDFNALPDTLTVDNFAQAAQDTIAVLTQLQNDSDPSVLPSGYEVTLTADTQGDQHPVIKGCAPAEVAFPTAEPQAPEQPTELAPTPLPPQNPPGNPPTETPFPTQPPGQPPETPVWPTQTPWATEPPEPTQTPWPTETQVWPTNTPFPTETQVWPTQTPWATEPPEPTPLPTNVPPATQPPLPTDAPPSTLIPTPANTETPPETPIGPVQTPIPPVVSPTPAL